MDADVIVIGAGLAGASTARALAARGHAVLLLEQFQDGHDRGSSHGSARIVRRVYGDEFYVDLTGRAFEQWRELELTSGASLLRMLGGLDFGPLRYVPRIAEALTAQGVEHEVLPADEASRRWPGMVFEGDVIFHPQAGTMDAATTVTTMIAQSGCAVRYGVAARSVSPDGVVTLDTGETISAAHVVVTAGAWVEPLLSGVVELPPIRITQQQVFHFPRLDPSADPWPSTIHEAAREAVYHLAGGRDGGANDDRKIGQHDGGVTTTADTRDSVVRPSAQATMVDYVRRWLPGLSDEPSSAITCLYTETPTEDFVIDRVGPVVVCSPCSGHGAKFAPLIGDLVADLVEGGEPLPRFSLAAHRSGRVGAVSL